GRHRPASDPVSRDDLERGCRVSITTRANLRRQRRDVSATIRTIRSLPSLSRAIKTAGQTEVLVRDVIKSKTGSTRFGKRPRRIPGRGLILESVAYRAVVSGAVTPGI